MTIDLGSVRQEPTQGKASEEVPITLLICDDHHILSDALAVVVGLDPGLKLLADPFDRADAVVAAALELAPDVVLMDVTLLDRMNGFEATRAITAGSPHTKVVVMSGTGDPANVLVEAIEAGAAGYLPKTEAATTILAAVRLAANGESLLSPTMLAWAMRRVAVARTARREVDQLNSLLTDREREILQRMSEGASNCGIAEDLHLSVLTINTHVRNILLKLKVHSKLQAVAWAIRSGIVTVKW